MHGKKIVGIIPARSGSKGLKDKNIKLLNGKPMIAYTIEAAKESKIFDAIIVSTDSQAYANIAERYGATVLSLRPKHLSEDETKTSDVIEYVIKELEKNGEEYDCLMILQPTSPLRKGLDIANALSLMIEKNANSVVSVCMSEHTPLYMNTLDDSLSMDNFLSKDVKLRRQELPQYYRLNGAIYLSKVDYYLEYKDLYHKNSYAYIMDKISSIDVDNELDFKWADYLLKEGY